MAEITEMPDWSTFYAEYVRPNKPVVFRGSVTSQPAFKRWTDEYLTKNWGKREVGVEMNKSETRGGDSTQIKFSKMLKDMYKEEHKDQYYAIVDFDGDPKAKADFFLPPPINCKEIMPQSMTLWISSGGTTSVLHQDDAENVLMLLAGRKSVMLVHQDEAQKMYASIAEAGGSSPVHQDFVDMVNFPKFANVSWISGEIRAGDMLYIPHTYWHQVNSYERNLGVNLWWQHKEDWRWWDHSNEAEYNFMEFGSEGWIAFDDLKARATKDAKCTPLPEDMDLSQVKFVDEGKFKKYADKKRKKANKKAEL